MIMNQELMKQIGWLPDEAAFDYGRSGNIAYSKEVTSNGKLYLAVLYDHEEPEYLPEEIEKTALSIFDFSSETIENVDIYEDCSDVTIEELPYPEIREEIKNLKIILSPNSKKFIVDE